MRMTCVWAMRRFSRHSPCDKGQRRQPVHSRARSGGHYARDQFFLQAAGATGGQSEQVRTEAILQSAGRKSVQLKQLNWLEKGR